MLNLSVYVAALCRFARPAVVLALLVLSCPLHAHAATVTATITGTVYSGTNCFSGATGCVFGLTTNLATLPFTLVYTFDDTIGTETGYACSTTSAGLYNAEVSGASNTTGNPGSAVLTITDSGNNPWPFNFVGSGYVETTTSSYAHRLYAGLAGCHGSEYVLYEAYADYGPSGSGFSRVDVQLWPATGSYLSASGDWREPISSLTPKNVNTGITFTIEHYNGHTYDAYAYGYLTPLTYSVSSPGFSVPSSEAANWQGWLSNSDPNPGGPIGLWLHSLTMPSGYLANLLSSWVVQEQDAGGGTDTCNPALINTSFHYSGPPHLTPGNPWHVTSGDIWGDATKDGAQQYDAVGEPDDAGTDPNGNPTTRITYLRSLPTGTLPCSLTRYQQMKIDFADGRGWQNYGSVNTLLATVGTSTVLASKSNDTTSPHSKGY